MFGKRPVSYTPHPIKCIMIVLQFTVQPARNLHKPSDPGGQNYLRAVEHRGRTPVDPGGHDPRVSR